MPKLVLDFDEEAADIIMHLQRRMKLEDIGEVMAKALGLLDTAEAHVKAGGYIFFKTADGKTQRVIL